MHSHIIERHLDLMLDGSLRWKFKYILKIFEQIRIQNTFSSGHSYTVTKQTLKIVLIVLQRTIKNLMLLDNMHSSIYTRINIAWAREVNYNGWSALAHHKIVYWFINKWATRVLMKYTWEMLLHASHAQCHSCLWTIDSKQFICFLLKEVIAPRNLSSRKLLNIHVNVQDSR